MRRHRPSGRDARPTTSGPDTRTSQLCAQALEAVSLAIASSTDPRLFDAVLRDVVPHPDASCLMLVVTAPAGTAEDVRAALRDAQTYLRHEIAVEVNRKRAPDLTFTVVPTLDPSDA